MSEKVRVAVVGGGIVGCSLLYCLARQGLSDTLLLEKNELTSGSTWHAAGNTTYFGHYPSITRLYVNSVKTYLQAEQETGRMIGFHAAGSLRIANSEAELESYRRLAPGYEALGVAYEVIGRERIESLHPLLRTEGILGAAHTPTDGHLDPSGATRAVAQAARRRGAQIRRNSPLVRLERAPGGWLLHTEDDSIQAEQVVLASSFWSRELTRSIGLDIPVFALKHQAVLTDSVPAIEALDFELPTIRDAHGQYNMRQEGKALLGGFYEPDPQFWAIDGIPPDFNQQLFEAEPERLERNLESVIERVPVFGEVGIREIVHGPICYTPDALPLLGPADGFPGLWLACGFCVGIATGGGAADFLARWMVDGRPPYELPMVYPSRFAADMTLEQSLASIRRIYEAGYSAGGCMAHV